MIHLIGQVILRLSLCGSGKTKFTPSKRRVSVNLLTTWMHAPPDADVFAVQLRPVVCCRYNCGTGAAHLVSERGVVTGQWHSVSVNREGTTGWLRLDNHTPATGQSQVGVYTHTHTHAHTHTHTLPN